MKNFGSLIWFVFQWSTQKKTCDHYRDRHAQNNAANKKAKLAKKVDNAARDKLHAKRTRKKLENMTDSELAKEVDRLNLERQYSNLRESSARKGKVHVADVLDVAGDVLAIGASALTIAVGISKLMHKGT